jgi:hypothetical protein
MIRLFGNLSDLTTKRCGWNLTEGGRQRPCSLRGPRRLFSFLIFLNDLKWRNCKHESWMSRKVTKLCNVFFHLIPFRALKSNWYSARYNIRRKETEYEHMWPCSVVWGFQPHGGRSVAILRAKCHDLGDGGWLVSGSSTKNNFISIYFDHFNALFRLRRPYRRGPTAVGGPLGPRLLT